MLQLKHERLRVLLGNNPTVGQERAALRLDASLTEVDNILDNADVATPLEVLKDAWATRCSIEWLCSEAERKLREAAEEAERKRVKDEERRREHQHRLDTDPDYRKQVEQRKAEEARAAERRNLRR